MTQGFARAPKAEGPGGKPVFEMKTAEGKVDFAALGLTGKESGAELLATHNDVRAAPLHVRDNFAREGSRWQNRSSSAAIAKSAGSAKRSTTSRMGAVHSGS